MSLLRHEKLHPCTYPSHDRFITPQKLDHLVFIDSPTIAARFSPSLTTPNPAELVEKAFFLFQDVLSAGQGQGVSRSNDTHSLTLGLRFPLLSLLWTGRLKPLLARSSRLLVRIR